jgi:hypothetical protein
MGAPMAMAATGGWRGRRRPPLAWYYGETLPCHGGGGGHWTTAAR